MHDSVTIMESDDFYQIRLKKSSEKSYWRFMKRILNLEDEEELSSLEMDLIRPKLMGL